uniref:Gnk2-homologous domain-containing protein n=1 Tax=Glycine max TaxID=3847 RepID=K7LLD9_SOYBN
MVTQRASFYLCLLVILITQATAEPDDQYPVCLSRGGDYAPNSTYHTNLNTVLSRLTSNTQIDYGFYNSSYGQDSDRVYATGLCRGDVSRHTCLTCLNNSSFFLLKNCPHQKEAVGFGGYDKCILHYADQSMFSYQDSSFRFYFWEETNVTNWDQYSYVLNQLLSRLRVKAATSNSNLNRKFAAGNATVPTPSSQTIYAVVQCYPDLTAAECNDCLIGAFSEIPKNCNNRSGCGVTILSCNFRYENSSFYEPTPDTITLQFSPQGSPSPTPSITSNSSESTYHGKSSKSQAVNAKYVVAPILFFVGLLILICIYLRVRKPTKHFESETMVDDEIKLVVSSQFDFDTIRVATNNFSDANKLGQGGFGPVYRGHSSINKK